MIVTHNTDHTTSLSAVFMLIVVHDELDYLTVFQVLIFSGQMFYIMFIVRQYGRMLKIVEIIEPNAAHNEDRC